MNAAVEAARRRALILSLLVVVLFTKLELTFARNQSGMR